MTAVDATTVRMQLTEPNGAAYLLFSTIHPIIKDQAWRDHLAPDRVDFAFSPDSDALVAAQASEQVDVIWVDDVERSELQDAEAPADTTVLAGASEVAVQLSLNQRSEPLMDPLVRRAILHAIDRSAIADTVDVDEANRLLDEAGWLRSDESVFRRKGTQDLALKILLFSDSDSINTAIAIEDALQEVGIDITGTPASSEFTNQRMNDGAFDLLLQFRVFNSDPGATALLFATDACPATIDGCTGAGANFGAFSNAEVDSLFDGADRINDPLERRGSMTSLRDWGFLAEN